MVLYEVLGRQQRAINNIIINSSSYDSMVFTARCYASAVLAVRLCLRLSQVGVLLKRVNVGSHKQSRTIAQGL